MAALPPGKPASGGDGAREASSHSLVLGLLALLVIGQVIHHLAVMRHWAEEQQVAKPGPVDCGSVKDRAANPKCAEANLFKSWEESHLLAEHEPEKAEASMSSSTATPSTQPSTPLAATKDDSAEPEEEKEHQREEALDNLKKAISGLRLSLLHKEIVEEEWKLDHPDMDLELAKEGHSDSELVEAVIPSWTRELDVLQQEADKLAKQRDGQRAEPPATSSQPTVLRWSMASGWKENFVARNSLRGTNSPGGIDRYQTVELGRADMLQTGPNWTEPGAPSVACVTVIPIGRATAEWLDKFIRNYRLQTYEGRNHLVLVYHTADRRAAQLVKQAAAGAADIKFGAAHGEKALPSTTAFRFGAWLAENGTQVIARWDFDAWHHPDRLAMQVRSLALVGRPAAMLSRWDLARPSSTYPESEGKRWGGSMVGDAEWMKWHWYPQLFGEQASDDLQHAHRLVKVDMPELVVYGEADSSEPPVEENTLGIAAK